MNKMLKQCILCPRECGVNRNEGGRGYCQETSVIKVARASLHMWEEPCISVNKGSGTIFFSGCSLKCVFCQNRSIAIGNKGIELTSKQLTDLFLLMQDNGADNINLVTPSHFVPQIVKSLEMAKNKGLNIPIVYNTGNYEKVEIIKMLDGLIDIYLPDMKYKNSEIAAKYSNAPDYFKYASTAIEEMVRQTGDAIFDNKIMKRGVIVRHMIMPGNTKDSKDIIKYLYDTFGERIYISIMNQYTPTAYLKNYPEIDRKVTAREYKKVIDYAIDLGIEKAFIQEGETAKESFIPDFNDNVFLDEIIKRRD